MADVKAKQDETVKVHTEAQALVKAGNREEVAKVNEKLVAYQAEITEMQA